MSVLNGKIKTGITFSDVAYIMHFEEIQGLSIENTVKKLYKNCTLYFPKSVELSKQNLELEIENID
jgi:hypothetical protein